MNQWAPALKKNDVLEWAGAHWSQSESPIFGLFVVNKDVVDKDMKFKNYHYVHKDDRVAEEK